MVSPRGSKEGRSLLREQKRKLTKKYESLVTALVDRCEENVIMVCIHRVLASILLGRVLGKKYKVASPTCS